jgi:hypothetical protein
VESKKTLRRPLNIFRRLNRRIRCSAVELLVYLGACLIAGIRLARERQVNVRVVPTGNAIENRLTSPTRFSIACFLGCQTRYAEHGYV